MTNDMPFQMDVVPAGTAGGNGGWGNGWGDSWLFIIVILALFGGWGNGWGNNGGGSMGGGNYGNLCDAFSFQDVKNGVRGIEGAIADGFAATANQTCTLGYQNAQLINGVQMQVANEFRGLDNAVCTLGYQTQQGINSLGAQLADCCCKTQTAIQGVNYNLATQGCETRSAINDGVRAILDKLTAQEIAQKDAQIAAQSQALFAAELRASQEAQNNYLVGQLGQKCPQAAYLVCNPNAGLNYSVNYGTYGGCGCNA